MFLTLNALVCLKGKYFKILVLFTTHERFSFNLILKIKIISDQKCLKTAEIGR